jgi:single-strand DNA-binding protein
MVDSVSYFDCSAWGRPGETIAQYLKKGSGILISGRLEQRSWEDKDGQKRSRVEIVVEDFNFVGGGDAPAEGGSSRGGAKRSSKASKASDEAPDDISDEPIDLSEIPF